MRNRLFIFPLLLCFLLAYGCASSVPAEPEPSKTAAQSVQEQAGTLSIQFEYKKQSGLASNQFAVWVEDWDGVPVKTLYVTEYTATKGHKNRPDSIPVWVERVLRTGRTYVDAVAGATPGSGALTYTWNLTDETGRPVPAGTYRFFVEGTLRWKNQVLYTGEINMGDEAARVLAQPKFTFEGALAMPALTDTSRESGMIGPVTADYTPPTQS